MTAVAARGSGGAAPAEASARPAVPPRPGARRARARAGLVGWAFAGPNLLLTTLFLFVPIGWAVVLSMQETRGFGTPDWVGLDNYARLAGDPVFWRSLANTIAFTVLTVPVEMAAGLGLAVLLNSVLPARGVFRTIIVLPMVISGVATGQIAGIIFYESNGIVNKLLAAAGGSPVAWQSEGVPALLSVVIATIWLRIGFNMIIYLAALQGIEPGLTEAARIDGANRWQLFRFLTVPLVGPATFFLLIMNVIASFQVFDLIFVLTGGGPGNATSVLVTYAYRNGFQIREQGYGAAIGVVILVITLVFTWVQWRTSRTRDLTG